MREIKRHQRPCWSCRTFERCDFPNKSCNKSSYCLSDRLYVKWIMQSVGARPKRTLLIVFKPFLLHAWPKPACSPSYFWEQPPQSELRKCLPTFWARQLLDTMEGVSVDVRACASCQAQRFHTFGILFQFHRKECLLLFCLAPLLSRHALAANCRSRSMTSAMCCAITTYLTLQCWI